MELERFTDNDFVHSRRVVRAHMPKHVGQHKQRARWKPKRPRRGAVVEYVGLGLVQWHIEQGNIEAARELLNEIKAQ